MPAKKPHDALPPATARPRSPGATRPRRGDGSLNTDECGRTCVGVPLLDPTPAPSNPRVLVVMSTFNGEKHLPEQIASVLSQTNLGSLRLLIRDDGSTDATTRWLRELDDDRVEVVLGENLGVKASFLRLLRDARRRRWDYLALADQDDVWHADKLARATARLGSPRRAALYCSALDLVDERLRFLRRHAHRQTIGFEEGFLCNAATGCSCVLTRGLLEHLEPLPRPDAIHMHDWWIFLVALGFGHVSYDLEPRISYRQHASNVNGMPSMARQALTLLRERGEPARRVSRARQAAEYARVYGHRIPQSQRRYLKKLADSEQGRRQRLEFALAWWPPTMTDRSGWLSRVAFASGVI